MREGTGGLLPAAEIPDSEIGETETSRLAFCPMLFEQDGYRGLCGNPDCGECQLTPEGKGWLCSTCAKKETTLSYYTDGLCTQCGEESPVLSLWKK